MNKFLPSRAQILHTKLFSSIFFDIYFLSTYSMKFLFLFSQWSRMKFNYFSFLTEVHLAFDLLDLALLDLDLLVSYFSEELSLSQQLYWRWSCEDVQYLPPSKYAHNIHEDLYIFVDLYVYIKEVIRIEDLKKRKFLSAWMLERHLVTYKNAISTIRWVSNQCCMIGNLHLDMNVAMSSFWAMKARFEIISECLLTNFLLWQTWPMTNVTKILAVSTISADICWFGNL